ncbi:MAG: carbohydrate ABC transporter permease [Alicyclobacillaceae bacterium]|uniref:carbohydrate ABC transporter permease n=1 Tax=Alicyclobacillus sp. SP_1 TaxID=2942475 RepID=UPI00215898D9|nr:carbohydrate ABC transporter permease [Alicyclobacillus sp. SP_1]MCY0889086.1 carbohydrate ABC transporter permease [Alicyclobacillaceae bacterium]
MGAPSDVIAAPWDQVDDAGKPKKQRRWSWRLLILVPLGVVFLMPFWWMIVTSLLPNNQVFDYPPHLFPTHPQWQDFAKAWSQPDFPRYMFNSIFVSVAIVIGQLITSSLAAYSVARVRFTGRRFVYWLILATLMIPGQVTFIPVFLLMKQLNWIDTYQALIVPFIGSAFATFWLVQSFRQVPQVILDAAQMDGAGHLWVLWRVVIPLCKPALISVAFLNLVFHYNDFFWPLIVTQTNSMRTIPVGLSYLVASDGSGTLWNILMASSLIAIIPTLILFLLGQRFFVQGTSTTGLKD